jgi:hypothetical protein
MSEKKSYTWVVMLDEIKKYLTENKEKYNGKLYYDLIIELSLVFKKSPATIRNYINGLIASNFITVMEDKTIIINV